ncbi:MAG TPA: DUF1707 domain-containing protein [Trebonia sp.]|nr:DUF1707 domain-containing protein [Trebonia sp.]
MTQTPTPDDQPGAVKAEDALLRASDAERDAAVRSLTGYHVEGRLDPAEFDQRAGAALAARTRDQLRALFTDLPGPSPVPDARGEADPASPAAPAASTAARMWRRGPAPTRPGFPPLILAPVLLALAVIAVLHGFPPFPLIPLAFVVTRRHRRWNREARPWI